MPQARKSDIVLLGLISCVWGVGCSAIKYTQNWMGPVVLNLWTLGISIVVLSPFAYVEARQRKTTITALTARDCCDYAVMGLLGLTSMTLLYTWGARLSLAANLALVTTMVPVLTAIIGVAVLREHLTRARILGLFVALLGVIVISNIRWGTLSFLGGYLHGNLLLTAGAMGNAVYVVFGKKLLKRSGPMTVLFWGQVLGFIGSIPFLYLEPFTLGSLRMYTLYTWLALIFLGTIFYSYTMVIFYRILVRLDAGQIMVFSYLQPVFGVIMAAVLLHERLTVTMAVGGLLVVAGSLIVALERSVPLTVVESV